MSEHNHSGFTNTLVAFLIGGAVGAGIALLYAPASGEETRKRIRDGAGKIKARTKEGYDAVLEGMEESLEALKSAVQETRDEVKAAYEAVKDA